MTALVGFTALAMEAGKWYLVKAEVSKTVDAAALAGAKNISNPHLNLNTLVEEFARENFSEGYLGTSGCSINFDDTEKESGKIKITGSSAAVAIFARLFGIDTVQVSSYGTAAKKEVEIMMVLDRSGSMSGQPMRDLKEAAKSFLDYFEDTQDKDKMGLISFATGVKVEFPLGNNFVEPMKAKIDDMVASLWIEDRYTNAEDAIHQSDDPSVGFTDQTGVPGNKRIQQFLIFFTDGNPNAFRSKFTRNGIDHDAVVYEGSMYGDGTGPIGYLCDPTTGKQLKNPSVPALPTGDGLPYPDPDLTACGQENTRWWVFEDYSIDSYSYPYCSIPEYKLRPYVSDTARQMAIDHAQELKDKHIKIYVIGLGHVREDYLKEIVSDPDSEYYYYTPDSGQLEAIFNAVAKEISLRLVD